MSGTTTGVANDRSWLLPIGGACLAVLAMIYVGPVHAKLAALGYPAGSFGLRYLAVTLIGAAVGVAELQLRYRDEPTQATMTLPGAVFVLLNGAVAALALFLVEYFGATPGSAMTVSADGRPMQPGDTVQRVLLSGLGGMVVLRGKLLTVAAPGGHTAEVGFAPVVEAILASVNRAIDRGRAYQRLRIVAPLARELAPLGFGKLAPFLRVGLQSLQTLDKEVQRAVLANIEALEAATSVADGAKLEAVGYDLLNNFGDDCFLELFRQAAASARLVP
jgi:hypothetical protein